jgi:tetratricopeptide (TPR) repeat protein
MPGFWRATAPLDRVTVPPVHACLAKLLLCSLLLVCQPMALAQMDHIAAAARLLNQGQLDAAAGEAEAALQVPQTRPLALAMLGTIRLQQGRYEDSERLLTQSLRLNPNLVGARITLGDAYLVQNKLTEARNSFQEALRHNPSNFDARFHLAKVEASLSNFQGSLEIAEPIKSKISGSDEGLLLLATDDAGLNKKDKISGLYAQWKQLPEHSSEISLDFGLLLAKLGMREQAESVLDDAAQKVEQQAPPGFVAKLAQGYFMIGALDTAEKEFTAALAVDQNCAACELGLAEIAEREGNTEKALSYLIPAKKAEPDNPEVLFEFGKVCLQQNLVKDALPALEKAVAQQPDRDSYTYVLASADVASGNLTEAASLLTRLLKKHPQDAALNYAMGAVHYLEGKFQEAESSLTRSLQAQPDQVAATYYLGLTYDAIGDDEHAVATLEDLLKRHPDHGLSYVKLGTILLREHKYEDAQRCLNKAISLVPDSIEAHYQRGILLRRLGKTAESENELAQSRKLESEHTPMRLQLLLPE